ncbi:hypothetical protein HanPSC8_Chr11g0485041 [Helianthus annuus]|nr:hypothetical protein HanPSC8_Chr11g0485041 [Helianthus annuus]
MVVVQAQGQRRLRVRVSIGNDQSVIDDGVSPNSDDKPTKMSYDAGSGYSDGGDFRQSRSYVFGDPKRTIK